MISSARQAIACILAIFSIAVVAHAQSLPAKEPDGTISGKVTMKSNGVPGVNVVVRRSDLSSSRRREVITSKAITAEDGTYRITNLPPGEYRIMAVAPVFVPSDDENRERVLILGKDETIEHVDFTLVRDGTITGKVTDAEGRAVVEEPVSLINLPGNRQFYPPYNSSTDDRGVYRLYGLRPGSYKVVAGRGTNSFGNLVARTYKQTYYPSTTEPDQATVVEVSEGSETRDIDIVFSRTAPAYIVRGRVVDGETGQPIPSVGYGITRYEQGGSSSRGWGAVTNTRGEFRMENLSPGTYAVSIAPPPGSDWRVEEMRFEIVDHDVTDLVLKTLKSATVSGVVVLEGVDDKAGREHLKRMAIVAYIEGRPQFAPGATSNVNEDGSFEVRGLGSGTALFYLRSHLNVRVERVERDGVIQPRGTIVREREHVKGVRIFGQIGNATLRGKIDVAHGTLPADARFSVWARRLGEEQGAMYSSGLRTQVDTRGQFAIEGLTSGNYELEAGVFFPSAKLGYMTKKQVVVAAGSTTDVDITVDLSSTPIKQP